MMLHQDGRSGGINNMGNRNTFDKLVECHLEDCKARLSPSTVKNHRSCLNLFMRFVNGKDITDLTVNDVRLFFNNLKEGNRAKSTLIGKFCILRSFFRYIEIYHGITIPILDDIDINDYTKSTWEGQAREALTKGEVRRLIEEPNNPRDTLIIALLYYGGFRVNEIAHLKTECVDTINRIISVIGKGNKPRKVPYSEQLDRAIHLWLHSQRKGYCSSNSPYFFTSKHGEHLSPKTISNMVHDYAVKAGIQKVIGKTADERKIYRVHTHILRHSYATHAADDDIPITLIQKMMGHNNISTTFRYMREQNGFKAYFDKFQGV